MKNLQALDRVVTLRELNALNEKAMDLGYHYTLYFETYLEHLEAAMKKKKGLKWRGMETKVVLVYLMWHDYTAGAAVRCQVFSDGLVPGYLKLDVPEMTFYQLAPTLAA